MVDFSTNAHAVMMLRNAYIKLDGMPLSFGILPYSKDTTDEYVVSKFGIDLNDTIRELRISVDDVSEDSEQEMHIENRILYHAIKRFRHSAAVYFKFSTATDGKSVDKTAVPKMLKQILDELDNEFKEWRGSNSGSLWNRSVN